jgi:hypothetical protein
MQRGMYVMIAALCLSLHGFVPPTLAFEAAILAPVRCDDAASCGEDITIEEAKLSSVKTSAIRTDCLKSHSGTPDTCFLKSAALGNICGKYYWARVEDYPDGNTVLTKLIALAENGKPFGVQGPNRYQIVQSATSLADETHLALCLVTEVSGLAGPPRNCATVAIITPEGTWLRGVDERACKKMPSFGIGGGAINIDFEIMTKKSPLLFANNLKDRLVDKLKLTSELNVFESSPGNVGTVTLRFTAPIGLSKILQGGWHDTFDFFVGFYREDGKIVLRGAAHPMVCRQNLPNITQFSGLNNDQKSVYALFLDNEVAAAIQSLCKHYEKKDSKTIVCD